MKPIDPQKDSKKLEEYELDNHVRTMTDAHKIMSDKNLLKQVHKHAKNKKQVLGKISKLLETPDEEAMETPEHEASESKSFEKKEHDTGIDRITSRKKKLKSKMFGKE